MKLIWRDPWGELRIGPFLAETVAGVTMTAVVGAMVLALLADFVWVMVLDHTG